MSEEAKGLVYFLPSVRGGGLARRRVEDAGLGYLFDGRGGPGPTFRGTSAGPGGQAGFVFSVSGRNGRGGPDPKQAWAENPETGKTEDKARWSQIPGTEAWVGVLADSLPGPDDLARCDRIEGYEVELGDGAPWTVPVVRLLDGGSGLPRALSWDGQSWKQGDVRPAYRSLWAAALRMWDALSGSVAEGEGFTLTESATTCAVALALNYRIGPAEISALGLLDTRSEVAVLRALIDLPALAALRGKAGAASPS